MTADESAFVENAPEPPGWLRSVERVVASLERAGRLLTNAAEPEHDLQPGADRLSESLGALFGAVDQRGDRLGETRRATGLLIDANEALEPAAVDPMVARAREIITEAQAQLAEVEGVLAKVSPDPEAPPRLLRASRGTPSLHDVKRDSLAPSYKVPQPIVPSPEALPPLPKATSAAEVKQIAEKVRERAAERRAKHVAKKRQKAREERKKRKQLPAPIPEGFVDPLPVGLDGAGFAKAKVRDCFEEVAMLGSQRTPQLGDAWRSIAFLDKRLLSNLDAVASLGSPAVHAIETLIADSPVKDPSRGFAAAFLLGCIEGRDTLAAAERVIRHLGPDDPEVWSYAAHALQLVPHPHLGMAMRTLLDDYDPALRSLGLEVLVRRQMVSVDELAKLVKDDAPEVVRVALPALALGAPRHPDLATRIVEADGTAGLETAAWLAMALSAHPRAAGAPEQRLDDEELGPEAATAVALVCDPTATEKLRRRCQETPKLALVRALGWCGDAENDVPLLIDLLKRPDDELKVAAARALDRICAAELYEEAEIDPEEVMIPEPPTPDMGALEPPPPLAKEVSDPRDEPADGSPDTVVRPSTDPARWQAWWKQQKGRFESGARYRRGRGFTPQVALWELDGWMLTADERRHLQRELVVRTGHWVALDPREFVERQEDAIRRWSDLVTTASQSPGSWTRPSRRVG